jgi:hypothetical protein
LVVVAEIFAVEAATVIELEEPKEQHVMKHLPRRLQPCGEAPVIRID